MEQISRYGTPTTRLISMLKCLEYPLRNVRQGDSFVVMTDDQIDV